MPDGKCAMLSKEQFQREANYRVAMGAARKMLATGLISKTEFVRIERKLAQKFSPIWSGLYQNKG